MDNINQQVLQTFQHSLPGTWAVYREEPRHQHLQAGGLAILGNDVQTPGDQYLVGVNWTLYDDQMRMAGLHGAGPAEYDPLRGSARVALRFGVQGYRPGDAGALGGMIRVKGRPMTPVWGDKIGVKDHDLFTPYEVAKQAEVVIQYYAQGYFRPVPGGVSLADDYYAQPD